MREWRQHHPESEEQRRRGNARSLAGVYQRRGVLVRQPCRDCGTRRVQMHHPDYERPLEVVWLCRRCRLRRHREGIEATRDELAPLRYARGPYREPSGDGDA
jgi:hypothetical protein